MARGLNLSGPYPLRSISGDQYAVAFRFTTNTTSDPDGVTPAVEDANPAITIAYSASGTFTATFANPGRPQNVDFMSAQVLGDKPGLHAKCVSYTASTGVLLIHLYDEDNTSGIEAKDAADLDDIEIAVLMLCSRK